jgi:RNA polymerase sigma factor (sigma-70 family)
MGGRDGVPARHGDQGDAQREAAPWAIAAASFSAWLDGDREAMTRLVGVMNPVLWHVVRAYGLDESRAKDVVQDAWLALVRSAASIDDPVAVAAWLTVTARRAAWRAAKKSSTEVVEDAPEREQRSMSARSAEDDAVARLGDSTLWRAVHTLSERCQRLLRVIAFDVRPDYRRIAADLGMPIGSIGPTRSRCLQKLRSQLQSMGELS